MKALFYVLTRSEKEIATLLEKEDEKNTIPRDTYRKHLHVIPQQITLELLQRYRISKKV
jgi:hypothetical protein